MALSGEAEMHSPRKFPKREPQPFFTETERAVLYPILLNRL